MPSPHERVAPPRSVYQMLFGDTAKPRDDFERVPSKFACPQCNQDRLEFLTPDCVDDAITCDSCGRRYDVTAANIAAHACPANG